MAGETWTIRVEAYNESNEKIHKVGVLEHVTKNEVAVVILISRLWVSYSHQLES